MNLTTNKLTMLLFLTVELTLYILILTAQGPALVWCSYISIVLCFLYALLHVKAGSKLFLAGLACTVAADYFLVVHSPAQQLWGMLFFLLAQSFYAAKLHSTCCRNCLVWLRIILSAAAAGVSFLVLGSKTDALAVVSVCYYANLILNILLSFLQFKRYRLAAIGFCLFILCDTVIGLQVASGSYLPIAESTLLYRILFMDFNLAWFFYLPSQVLLALSSAKN